MEKNYKGFTAYAGEVYKGKEKLPRSAYYDIDGEQLMYYELFALINKQEPANTNEQKQPQKTLIKHERDQNGKHESLMSSETNTNPPITPPKQTRTKGAQHGQNNINSDGIYIINKISYQSARQAAKATGIKLNTLIKVCKLGCSYTPKNNK